MKKTILTILTGAALAVGSANAAIVFGNLGVDGSGAIATSGGTGLTSSQWRAIGFTAGVTNLVLNTATIGLNLGASGNAVVRLDLYSNNAGKPGTSLFNTTQNIAANTLNQPITFTLNETLTAGATYWIVARRAGGTASPTALTWRPAAGSPAPTTQNGSGWTSLGIGTSRETSDGGVSWSGSGTGSTSSISLSASAIPEPGTWAAMAIFAGGAAYAGWRRRQQPA